MLARLGNGTAPTDQSLIYDRQNNVYYDSYGLVVDPIDAQARIALGWWVVDYGSGKVLRSGSEQATPSGDLDYVNGVFTDQYGNPVSPGDARRMAAAGSKIWKDGVTAMVWPTGSPVPIVPVVTPSGKAPFGPGWPLAPQNAGVLEQVKAWLAKGNNAMYAFGGLSIAVLGGALLGGRRRR